MTEILIKEKIREWLVNNNIAVVKAFYQGGGDILCHLHEGGVEEISFILEDGTKYEASWIDPVRKKEHMYCRYFHRLANLIGSHIYDHFAGYEINEGTGYWEWTIKDNIIRIDHSEYEIVEQKEYIATSWDLLKIPDWMKENG